MKMKLKKCGNSLKNPNSLLEEIITNIVSVKKIGESQTYDLEVAHPDHQFYLTNGILTSNSHALAYGIDSYYCAWLLTYYEAEWLCAYMESMIGSPDSRAKAIAEIKSYGYDIAKVDINESGSNWQISKTRKAFVPSFSTLKAVGSVAIQEVVSLRPYVGVQDLFYNSDGSWKFSKFNKKAIEALIKMGAFESMGIVGPNKFFSSYKHMHHCIIAGDGQIKKSLKRDPYAGWKALQQIAAETYDMEEWTRKEFALFQRDIIGSVDAASLIPDDIYERLLKNEVCSVNDWKRLDLYWFVITGSTAKKTKKGKPYMLLEVTGDSGITKRMYMWDWDGITTYDLYTPCLGEVDCSEFGLSVRSRKMKILS